MRARPKDTDSNLKSGGQQHGYRQGAVTASYPPSMHVHVKVIERGVGGVLDERRG